MRYLPSEDTYLLLESLSSLGGGKAQACLEIGFGSGVVLKSLTGRFPIVVGTDLLALEDAKSSRSPGVEFVVADKASCFREDAFDLIFFNPPYLPSESVLDATVDGGAGGIAAAWSFLEDALRSLRPDGAMLVLLSDRGDIGSFVSRCASAGLSTREVSSRRLFFERLVVLEVKRIPARSRRG